MHSCSYLCAQTYSHICSRLYIHAHIYAQIKRTYAHILANMHGYAHIRTHMHTYEIHLCMLSNIYEMHSHISKYICEIHRYLIHACYNTCRNSMIRGERIILFTPLGPTINLLFHVGETYVFFNRAF